MLTDGVRPGADPPALVVGVPFVDHRVELGQRVDLGHRHQVVAAEPADLSLDPALLVSAVDAGLAVERLEIKVRTERGPPLGLHPLPLEAEHLGGRGPQVVVAHLAGRHPAQHRQRVDMPLEEGLLTAGGGDPVNCLAGEGHAESEQEAGHLIAPQPHRDLAEVDLRLHPGTVGLRHEDVHRPTPGVNPDLRFAGHDVTANNLVRHVDHPVLVDQPAEDPLHRVPLFTGRVKVSSQDRVDDRLERIQLRRPGRILLAWLGPSRGQRLVDGSPTDAVLAL
ncbi:MAG TPA: hypothetical protein VF821_24460 [Lentzea sp.]